MSELSQKLRELLAKATPGPWDADHDGDRSLVFTASVLANCPVADCWSRQQESDANLIAELVNNAPAIIAALEAAELRKDWVLAPREPEDEMIDAGDALNHASYNSQPTKEIYCAMIAAISGSETK